MTSSLTPRDEERLRLSQIADTDSLLLSDAHDVHGLHGLFIHLIILLAWDLNVASAQEAVITEGLQQKLL